MSPFTLSRSALRTQFAVLCIPPATLSATCVILSFSETPTVPSAVAPAYWPPLCARCRSFSAPCSSLSANDDFSSPARSPIFSFAFPSLPPVVLSVDVPAPIDPGAPEKDVSARCAPEANPVSPAPVLPDCPLEPPTPGASLVPPNVSLKLRSISTLPSDGVHLRSRQR